MSNDFQNHLQSTLHNLNGGNTVYHVCKNTLTGKYIPDEVHERIASQLNTFSDEKVEVLWTQSGGFEKDTVFVGITNYRVFKIENSKISNVWRSEIALQPSGIPAVHHISRNVFRWDDMEFVLTNFSKVSISIYHKNAVAFFVDYLRDIKAHPFHIAQ